MTQSSPPFGRLAAIALWAVVPLAACSGSADADNAGDATPVALVTLATAEQGTITQTVTLYGATEPGTTGTQILSAPADAIVTAITVPPGAAVGRGQVVAKLSPAPNTQLDLVRAGSDARAANAALARTQRLRKDGLVGDAEVETARAAAAAANATRASIAGQASGLTLRSPIAGFVETLTAHPGDRVMAGTAIATISRAGDLRARFGISPAMARRIRSGASVSVAAGPGATAFSAPVLSVNPVVDPQTRLASLFVRIPDGAALTVGETLTGEVAVAGDGNALTIPYAALLDDGGQPYVYVVANGVAHRRDVEIGPISGDRVAIAKGIGANARVVVEGGTAVEDGMTVRTR